MDTSKTKPSEITQEDRDLAHVLWIEARNDALSDIAIERNSQLAKWGVRTYDYGTWSLILAEEFGEVAQEMLTIQFARNEEEKELATRRLEKEAKQLSAVAAAILQQIKSGNA